MDTLDIIAARAEEIGPRCGDVTVLAIDGPAGSGKTTLAAALSARTGAALVHMDDLYPGWNGLHAGGRTVTSLLADLAGGRDAVYEVYDWSAGAYGEERTLHPEGILIIEGVGAVRTEHLQHLSVIVMVVEADPGERLRRGLARDGMSAREHWEEWMIAEAQLHEEIGLARLADVVVDGQGTVIRR